MNVVYASDENYVGLTTVSAVSLLKHNPGAKIHLLGHNLGSAAIDIVRSRVGRHGGTFVYFDISDRIAALLAAGAATYTSPAIYARIFIPELILGNERALYLDCDTLVTGPLNELFDIDLHGHAMALGPDCVHPAYKRVVSISENRTYFNSGVLLMDLKAWRERNLSRRFLDELAHPHGRICLPDQDVINRALGNEIEPLEPRWNYLSQYFLQGLAETPVIYHFSGHTLGRPWFTSSRHPLREAYRRAADEADLSQVAEQIRPMPFEYRLQYGLYRLLPRPLFTPICNLMYRTHIRLTYGV